MADRGARKTNKKRGRRITAAERATFPIECWKCKRRFKTDEDASSHFESQHNVESHYD